jgi:hypothetical protein
VSTVVDFLGLELDSMNMHARLPADKKEKAIAQLTELSTRQSCSLLEMQRLTGLLNFASRVVPLGRTFCRRLYDAEAGASAKASSHRIRLSGAVKADIKWWLAVLPNHSGIRVINPTPPECTMWTDAAGTKGIGGFWLAGSHPPIPTEKDYAMLNDKSSFTGRLRFRQKDEHINVKEMLAVYRGLKLWRDSLQGTRVTLYCDNTAVVSALRRGTTRGRLMTVLRRVLMLSALLHVSLHPQWLPSEENTLADALSRFDCKRVADLAPQLSLLRRTSLA